MSNLIFKAMLKVFYPNMIKKNTIKRICAWCGETIGTKDGDGQSGDSHGICEECLLHNFPDIFHKIHGDRPARKK